MHQNYIKKGHQNDVDSSPIEIKTKKVRRNNVNLLSMEITSKKYVKESGNLTIFSFLHIDVTICVCPLEQCSLGKECNLGFLTLH